MARQLYMDFDEYIRQGEPEAADNARQWSAAIGLQAVDGLKPSQYLIDAPNKWNNPQEIKTINQEKLGKDIENILEKLGKKSEKLGKKLSRNRIEIIKLIHQNPKISSIEMAKKIGISSTAIDNNIKQMRDIFIRRIGANRGGHWEIIE